MKMFFLFLMLSVCAQAQVLSLGSAVETEEHWEKIFEVLSLIESGGDLKEG